MQRFWQTFPLLMSVMCSCYINIMLIYSSADGHACREESRLGLTKKQAQALAFMQPWIEHWDVGRVVIDRAAAVKTILHRRPAYG
jgi:hypothetical protein